MFRRQSGSTPKWATMDDMSKYYSTYRPHGERAISLFARRPLVTIAAIFGSFLLFVWYQHGGASNSLGSQDRRSDFDGHWYFQRDRNNLMLDDAQCSAAFPKLFEEVQRAVEGRRTNHITSAELDTIEPKNGYIRAMIYDQEVLHPVCYLVFD